MIAIEKIPELVMWRAVVAQAITDAKYQGLLKAYLECKRMATSWFSNFSRDFKLTCHYADIDPDYAHQKFQRSVEKGVFEITSEQDKILTNKRTPAQMKYKKKGFGH